MTDGQSRLSATNDHHVVPPSGLHVVRLWLCDFLGTRVALRGQGTHRPNDPSGRSVAWVVLPRRSDQAVLVGVGSRAGARRHVELVEDVAEVTSYGPLAGHEVGGDFPVRLAG